MGGRNRAVYVLLFSLGALPVSAEQTVGAAAQKAAQLSGAAAAKTTPEKLLATLKLINVENYNHRNRGDPSPKITHPYEWDSKRTSEEMLADGNGGSCGTHALSVAAVLRASGVPASDVRLIGAVDINDYADICPGKAGAARAKQWTFGGEKTTVHPASGHVFVMVKWDGNWHLVNSTHNPIDPGPPELGLKGKAGPPSRLVLEDFEMTKLSSGTADSFLKTDRAQLVPQNPFPSYFRNKLEDGSPLAPLLPFASWAFEDYPIHGIADRANLVASGRTDSPTCRWSAEEVLALPQQGGGLQRHAPTGEDH